MQSEKGGRRILLDNNTGIGAVMRSGCFRLGSIVLPFGFKLDLPVHTYILCNLYSQF
jgi:hypothetical protein